MTVTFYRIIVASIGYDIYVLSRILLVLILNRVDQCSNNQMLHIVIHPDIKYWWLVIVYICKFILDDVIAQNRL